MNALLRRHSKLNLWLHVRFLSSLVAQADDSEGQNASDLLMAFMLTHQGRLEDVVGDLCHGKVGDVDGREILGLCCLSGSWQYVR